MKSMLWTILITALYLSSSGFASQPLEAKVDGDEELQASIEPLFVSLGSFCEPNHMLKFMKQDCVAIFYFCNHLIS